MGKHLKRFYKGLALIFIFTNLALGMESLQEAEENKPLSSTNRGQLSPQQNEQAQPSMLRRLRELFWPSPSPALKSGCTYCELSSPKARQSKRALEHFISREMKICAFGEEIFWDRYDYSQPDIPRRDPEELVQLMQPLSCKELEEIVENKKIIKVFKRLYPVQQHKMLTFLINQSATEKAKIFLPLVIIVERLVRTEAENFDAWLDRLAGFNSLDRISLIQSLSPLVDNYMEKEVSGGVKYNTLIKLIDILLPLKPEERIRLTDQASGFAGAHHSRVIPILLSSIIPLEEPIRQTVCTFLAAGPIFGRSNFDKHPSLLEKLFALIGSLPTDIAEQIGELTFNLFPSQIWRIEAVILLDCVEMLTLLSPNDLDVLKKYDYYFIEEDKEEGGASVKDFLCTFCEIEQDRRESVIQETCCEIVLKWRPSNPITALRFLKDLPGSYRQLLLSNGKKTGPGEKIGWLFLSCYDRIAAEERIGVFKDFCLFKESHVFSSTPYPQYQILEEIALLPAQEREFLLRYATDTGIKILKEAFKILKSTPEGELSKNPSLLFLNPLVGLPLSPEERLMLSQSELALKLEAMESIPSQCLRHLNKSYFYKFLMRTSPQDCKLFEQYIKELNLTETDIIKFIGVFDKLPALDREDVLHHTTSVMILSGGDKSNVLKLMQLMSETRPDYRLLICDYRHWLLKQEFYPDIHACLKLLADIPHHKRELLLQETHTLLTKDNNKAYTSARASERLQEIAGLSDEESSRLFKEVNLK